MSGQFDARLGNWHPDDDIKEADAKLRQEQEDGEDYKVERDREREWEEKRDEES